MTTYSQQNEQGFIVQAVACLGPSRFLDIGAFHPTCFSNTRALYEAGWSGVMFEPSPGPFTALSEVYGEDERIVLVRKAVGLSSGKVKLYFTNDAVSTTEQAQYEKWKPHAEFIGTVEVDQISVPDLLAEFGTDFGFVNVDTEGTSVDIFGALLHCGMLPQCFCVEHDGRAEEVKRLAEKFGYRIAMEDNGTNLVLAKQ